MEKPNLKPLGICPHCREKVRGKVIEECEFTRDVCICPNCEEKILVCRAPGCHNYTVEKNFFNELCPECAKDSVKILEGVLSGFIKGFFKK